MPSHASPTAPLLDDRCNRAVAALTHRLAQHERWRRRAACDHDFLVPLLRPDLLDLPATGANRHSLTER